MVPSRPPVLQLQTRFTLPSPGSHVSPSPCRDPAPSPTRISGPSLHPRMLLVSSLCHSMHSFLHTPPALNFVATLSMRGIGGHAHLSCDFLRMLTGPGPRNSSSFTRRTSWEVRLGTRLENLGLNSVKGHHKYRLIEKASQLEYTTWLFSRMELKNGGTRRQKLIPIF